jgi:hypothetical protein
VRGTIHGGELWALFFGANTKAVSIKIVWRMTGTGDLSLVSIGPNGEIVKPDWGPEPHGGSNWLRPGDEWGAGFTFPSAGCWDLHASRDDVGGDIYIEVT